MTSTAVRLSILSALLSFVPRAASAAAVADDFSSDSGEWSYVGGAYRDAASGHVVLARPDVGMAVGQIWLAQGWNGPFRATFKYLIGGASGADGLIFMFNKQSGYEPDVGGTLGFTLPPHASLGPVPGYGVEVDNWYNPGWEPTFGPHIALVKDTVANNLAWVDATGTRDSLWHTVEVKVEEAAVTVSVDGVERFHWSGAIDRTFSGLGFSGATGSATDWHIVDDVRIEDLSVTVGVDIKPGDANNTFNNDGSGVLPVAILGSAELDVTAVDPLTVTLQSLRVKVTGKGHVLASYEDVNGDGHADLVLQIDDTDAVFQEGDAFATLEGRLYDGTPIVGSDAIRLVP